MTFTDAISDIEDDRIPGMVTYPLTEILLFVFIGLLCRAEDFDEIEYVCSRELEWLRRYFPFDNGVAPAQTLRRVLARLRPKPL